ncbi:MAG: glutamyl-tRNA amidotransferase [Clostridia bacterium]|nr:glutamyl-tRNA amidotransferase [Clostridia bacterium]NCC44118.1 glutamyl-tRNA amidotransferase [Clostridia bacterium]
MVLVDIFVPSVNRTYDFNVDETAQVSMVQEELCSMICQKEQCGFFGDMKAFVLCDLQTRHILPKDKSLQECGVYTGKRLMLV